MEETVNQVSVDNEPVRFVQRGKSKEKVLLIHGFGIGTPIWDHVKEELSKEYTVILLDLAGYGLNISLSRGIDIKNQADLIDTCIEKLGIDNVVGYSYGGCIVNEYMRHHSSRIKKVILVSAPFFDNKSVEVIKFIFRILSGNQILSRIAMAVGTSFPVLQIILGSFKLINLHNKNVIRECITRIREHPNPALIFRSSSDIFVPIGKAESKLQIPLTFIYGENDGIAKLEVAHKVVESSKETEMFVLKNTYHLTPYEAPHDLVNNILQTLKK